MMKTSIKLLLGAFLFVVVLLIAANVVVAKQFKNVMNEQQNQPVDSVSNVKKSINIQFGTE